MAYKMKGPSLYKKLMRTTHGYRKGHTPSDHKIIPGDENGTKISMKEEDGKPLEKGKIKGEGLTTGKTKIMEPGKEYNFPNDKEVLETPIKRKYCKK